MLGLIKCYKCNTGPASFGGDRRWGVPGRLGERRNGRVLAIAALALVMTAGLLAAQPGGWIGAPSGDSGAAVLDAWPTSGDAAFAGLLPRYAFAQSVTLNLTAADSITNTVDLVLDGARGIATFESGGRTYAAVAAYWDDGIQILDITDPSDITAAGSITDTVDLVLDGARGIATFTSGGSTYAAVASNTDDGVQILDITDPSAITAAGSITDTATLELNGAWGITTFESGGSTYAAVAAYLDDGVQMLDITDPSNVTAADSITDPGDFSNDNALELNGARSIATFESGGRTYAAVAAYWDDGIQILDITDPSDITAAGSITDTGALELNGARGITTFESGGSTYAAVAAYDDDGVQILDITDPSNVTAAGSITDPGDFSNDDALELNGANDIATFESGGRTYAAVAAYWDDGVQILDITDPSSVTAADSITDTGALELDGAWGIATFESGGRTYAAVAAYTDDGVQILRLTAPAPAANSPPVVGAGADQEVVEGATVTLSGTATDADPEDILTYSWTHDGALAITFANPAALSTTFTAPDVAADTTVTVTLTVNDGTVGVSDALQVNITDSPNTPPTVEAGPDQEVVEGATVTLSGTATDADPEDILTYSWTHDGALAITFANPAALSTTFTAPDVAADTTVTVTLTVNDGTVGVSDALQVNITDSPNTPPTVEAGPDQEVVEGATVTLSGTATDSDPEDILTYSWTHDGALAITFANPAALSTTFTAPDVAADTTVTVTLTVNDGTVGVSDALQVNITDSPNTPPTVEAGPDQEVVEGATVTLSGTATDSDPEDILTYSWTHDGALAITFANPAALSTTFTAPDVAADTTVTVTLTVNDGTVGVSDALQVNITDSPNSPPVVGAGADQEVVEGATVTLSGTATDADPEDTLAYSWTHDGALAITFANPAALSTTFTAPDVAVDTTVTVTLTVNDGTVGVSDALQVNITDSPNIPPTADAGLNRTAAGSITDTAALELDGATGIATFESGGSTYAAVAAYLDDGVQILNVTDPSNVTAAGKIGDDGTNTDELELNGARDITVFESGGSTYAAVTGYVDDGVQILDITDPSNVTAAGSITDTAALELGGAQGIATFESGGRTYAAVAAYLDDGVQILDVTDPSNVTAAGNIDNTPTLELNGAWAITTFESGGSTYAAVAAFDDSGVQILNVTDPSNITAAGSIGDTPALKLFRASAITTFESGGSTYAAVTSHWDDGVQILNITDPFAITAADSITDTAALLLNGARGITTFESGGSTYAAVAAYDDDGVQILNITDPSAITAARSIGDTATLELDGARGITTFTSGGSAYAAVAAYDDDGVQILRLTGDGTPPPAANSPPVVGAGADQEVVEGATVTLSGTATDADPEDILTYSWTHDGALAITFANPAALSTTFTAPDVAADTAITVTLTVNDGTVGVSDALQVNITDSPNTPPTVEAGPDQEVVEGATVTLSGTATDSDPEDILTYSWTHDGALAIAITGSDSLSASFAAPNVAADTTITVTLTVNDGTVDASDTLQVTITDSANAAPTVNAGVDQTVAEGATVTLSGTATDDDPEDTLAYSWSHNSTALTIALDASAEDPSFTAPNVSEDTPVEFTLRVSDGTASVSDKVIITIQDSANAAPTVNAGPDQTVAEGATVTLSGTATDADPEDTLAYSWSHNSTALTIALDASAEDPSFTAPNVSEDTPVEFTLRVSDGTASVSDKVIITIQDSANAAPTVNAGPDQTVAEGSTVTLSGTATDDDPEDTLAYSWSHNSTALTIALDASAEDPSFTAPNVSEDTPVEFTLRVSDGTASVSDKVIITIQDSANAAPTVNAGVDQTVAEGATVTLSGTATDADPEDILTYSWTHDGALAITFANPAALSTTFTAPDVAADTTVTVTLTVNDGTVGVSDALQVNITDSPNSPPVVGAGADQEVVEGATVTLSGTATDADPEDILTYEWTHDGALAITFANPAALSTTFTAPDVAADTAITVTLTVNDGTVGVSDALQVNITDSPNSPPVVGAGADQEVVEGATVTLSGTATDADPEDILTYEWTHDGALAITFANPAALSTTFTAPDVAADTTVTVTLTVNDGTVGVSDALQVNITDSPNSPPVVGAGADQEVVEGATVTLSGTATDADPEDILTYEWTHDGALALREPGRAVYHVYGARRRSRHHRHRHPDRKRRDRGRL